MEKKNLQIGLLGFGSMGRVHAFCVENLPFFFGDLPFDAKITKVCTRHAETAKAAVERYGLGTAVTNEDDVIGDPEIDVIDVCTPNIYHCETVLKALAAGKHVLCEKPLCVTPEEAKRILDAERASGMICGMVFNNRHLAPVMRAKALIDEGRIGRVLSFRFEYLHNSCVDPARSRGWKQDREICGGGTLFDLGSHVLDLAHWLVGDFSAVTGLSQIAFPSHPDATGKQIATNADEAFYLMAELPGGGCGTVCASKISVGANDDLSFDIRGERGALRFSLMEPEWLYFYDATKCQTPLGAESGWLRIECVSRYPAPGGAFPSPKAPTGWLRGHVQSYYHYLSAIAAEIPFAPSFSDGAWVQNVMDAALRSAALGARVTL